MILKPLVTPYEWNWVKHRAKVVCSEDSQGIVAVDEGGIKGVAVFDSFVRNEGRLVSCNVHIAMDSPMCLRHGFLTEIADHLFGVIGLDRIFGLTPSTNHRALKFNRKIGWEEIARIPDALGEGVDYIVQRMDRDSCRWLKVTREAA